MNIFGFSHPFTSFFLFFFIPFSIAFLFLEIFALYLIDLLTAVNYTICIDLLTISDFDSSNFPSERIITIVNLIT